MKSGTICAGLWATAVAGLALEIVLPLLARAAEALEMATRIPPAV